jgi:heme-degrading monooxygenase HmoA
MYARVIHASVVPGKTDQAIATFRDEIVPIIKEKPGYLGTAIFVDREKGDAETVSLWETREAAEATGPGTDYLTTVVGMLHQYLANREYRHWEVGYFDRP